MSASGLQQVLHHYSEHVARLSIMGLQCGMILEDDVLVKKLKVIVSNFSNKRYYLSIFMEL